MYGIAHCDTVRKARGFLAEHRVGHEFHDYRKQGVPPAALARWVSALGWQALLNRKGTTWRNLDDAQRAAVGDAGSATALMLQHASVIRRPVVEWADGRITVGFDARTWSERC
jgi:Spx/MgsR family transcriptional regulator